MKNRNWLIALIGTGLCLTLGCTAQTKEKTSKPVKARAVEKRPTANGVRYSASIRPNAQVNLAFKVGGYVDSIAQIRDSGGHWRHIHSGDIVKKGTVLARVRQSDYQVRVNQATFQEGEARSSLETSNSQFAEARAAVTTAKAQLAEAQATFERAKLDFERMKNLFATESITKSDYDAANAQYESANARLSAAKSQVEAAEAKTATAKSQIAMAQARIKSAQAQTAEATIPLEDTQLRAPISGIVIERKVEVGSLISTGTAAFVLADLLTVKAAFGVPDLALQTLKLGDSLRIATDGVPGTEFTGHISRISPSADQSSRVFEVEVTIPNHDGSLKPGMIASLSVHEGSGEPADTPVVPLTAVTRSKEGAYGVFVVEEREGKHFARLRNINLGEAFGNSIAVTSGVKVGELVITTGATQIADGEMIQLLP